MKLCYLMAMHKCQVQKWLVKPHKLDLAYLFSVLYIDSSAYNFLSHLSISDFNPIRTGGFPAGWRFFANNFGSNKHTQSKLGGFS